jgi:uncharacterized membrane protein YeaQ/YmgE (transglycosylase-associated protein family)
MTLSLNGIEFTLVEMIVWLIVGALVGAIGSALVGYSPGGLIGSIAVGLVGALVGTWLARQLGLPALLTFEFNGTQMELLWAILGAALLVLLLSLARGGTRYRRRRYSS